MVARARPCWRKIESAAFLDPGAWGRSFAHAMDQYDHMAGMWIVGEDMPQESNAITRHAGSKRAFR